jgi:co-chaperonin GroES (HSP10)
MIPQNNFLILEDIKKVDEQTASGIFLPSQIIDGKDTIAVSIIYAASEKSVYKKGQKIVFSKYVPLHFEHEKQKFFVIKEEDVICLL